MKRLSVSPMIGRKRLFERLWGNLVKPTPDHLSLVGAQFFGKTVVLSAVANKLRSEGAFACVLEWDLGTQTPLSDTEFLQSLRARCADGLKEVRPDLHDYLIQEDSGYDELREVIDELGRSRQRVLMLWDRFDRALHSGQLTRNQIGRAHV